MLFSPSREYPIYSMELFDTSKNLTGFKRDKSLGRALIPLPYSSTSSRFSNLARTGRKSVKSSISKNSKLTDFADGFSLYIYSRTSIYKVCLKYINIAKIQDYGI